MKGSLNDGSRYENAKSLASAACLRSRRLGINENAVPFLARGLEFQNLKNCLNPFPENRDFITFEVEGSPRRRVEVLVEPRKAHEPPVCDLVHWNHHHREGEEKPHREPQLDRHSGPVVGEV